MIPIDILPPDLLPKSPKELLALLTAGKITKELVGAVRNRIKVLCGSKKYGFTPDPQTAKDLQTITKSDAYKRIKECIGYTRYLSVVKLGLRIEELSYTKRDEEIHKIKQDVFKKYGRDGINILNMGNTGALIPLIMHLSDLKIKTDASQEVMLDSFMEVIHGWEIMTIFHKTEDGADSLVDKINRCMDARYEVFFVFAIAKAGKQAAAAISSLSNDGVIHDKGYMLQLLSNEVDQQKRVHYGWVFTQLDPFAMDKITLSH